MNRNEQRSLTGAAPVPDNTRHGSEGEKALAKLAAERPALARAGLRASSACGDDARPGLANR